MKPDPNAARGAAAQRARLEIAVGSFTKVPSDVTLELRVQPDAICSDLIADLPCPNVRILTQHIPRQSEIKDSIAIF
jgi:hypothetical protein